MIRSSSRALLPAAALLAWAACGPGSPPSVVLITLDTTRVDHLSCYGYERETSPHLDALARESVRYTRAWSTSSWTLPAHASLFTGLYPSAHGARFSPDGVSFQELVTARVLDERFRTLAEILGERGYQSAAFVGGPWLKRDFGLLQGFETVDDAVPRGGRDASELTEGALAWLAGTDPERPVFLFVNYFDPHFPYAPPQGFDDLPAARRPLGSQWIAEALAGDWQPPAALLETMRDRYDGEIRAMDHELGRLLAALRQRPDGERLLVIVTADHGESFGEDDAWLHNGNLGEEVVRVPMIVRHPDGRGAGTVSDEPVQLVDVLPLVAEVVGFPLPEGVQGVLPGSRRAAYLELQRNPGRVARYGARWDRDLEAVVEGDDKLVVANRRGLALRRIEGLVERDAADPERAGELAARLERHREAVGVAEQTRITVDPETQQSLRELGYLE